MQNLPLFIDMRQCRSPSNRWSVSYHNGYQKKCHLMHGWMKVLQPLSPMQHTIINDCGKLVVHGQHHTQSLQKLFNDKIEDLLTILLHLLISASDKSCVTILWHIWPFAVFFKKKQDMKTWIKSISCVPYFTLRSLMIYSTWSWLKDFFLHFIFFRLNPLWF